MTDEIKGLYSRNDMRCLIHMGHYANRVRTNYELKNALVNYSGELTGLGWKRVSSKHLAVWND